MKTSQRPRRGSALILATIVVLVVSGIAAAFVTVSYNQSNMTFRSSVSETALYASEAGLEDTINKMNAYAKAEYTWLLQNPTATLSQFAPATNADFNVFTNIKTVTVGSTSTTQCALPTKSINGGTYSVTITPAFDGSKRAYTLASQGSMGKETRRIESVVSPGKDNAAFRYGLFGEVLVNLYGTSSSGSAVATVKVDSFKSTLGTYASQMTPKPVNENGVIVMEDFARANGNIASNQDVTLSSNMKVMGNVSAGPGVTPQVNGAYVNGTVSSLSNTESFPPPAYVPQPLLAAPNLSGTYTVASGGVTNIHVSAISLQSQTVTLAGPATGTGAFNIYVDGDIKANAQGKIIITGGAKVNLYQQAGALQFNGQVSVNPPLGQSQVPGNFLLWSQTSDTGAKWNGGSQFYGAIYAPKAQVMLSGTGDVYGAVVAKTINLGGTAQFHYDEDLNISALSIPVYNVKSWRESLR